MRLYWRLAHRSRPLGVLNLFPLFFLDFLALLRAWFTSIPPASPVGTRSAGSSLACSGVWTPQDGQGRVGGPVHERGDRAHEEAAGEDAEVEHWVHGCSCAATPPGTSGRPPEPGP